MSLFDVGFTRRPEVWCLSDGALRIWLAVADYAREHMHDAQIAPRDLDMLPRILGGKKRVEAISELVAAGLWLETSVGWEIVGHEEPAELELQAPQVETAREQLARKRAEAGRAGGLASQAKRHFASSKNKQTPLLLEASGQANTHFASSKTEAKTGVVPAPSHTLPLPPNLNQGFSAVSGDPSSFQLSSEGPVSLPARVTEVAPKPRPERKRPRHSLPTDWVPKALHISRAQELRIDVRGEAEKFRAHAEATGRLMANWDAAFTTWLLNCGQYQQARVASPGRPQEASGEERTRLRNSLLDDAGAGRYGPRAKAWADSGQNLGELADKLEQRQRAAPAVRALTGGIGR